MAEYCFCGCGRRVRFSKKRLSRLGARVEATLGALTSTTLPLTGDPQPVERLIHEGEQIRDLYAGLVHGTRVAPPVGMQARMFEWERDAGRVAQKSLRRAGGKRETPLQPSIERGGRSAVGAPDPDDLEERAAQWWQEALSFYKRPVSPEIVRLHRLYLPTCAGEDALGPLENEHWTSAEVASVVASVARVGYAFRLYEEDAFNITAPDRVSEIALRELMEEHPGADVGALVLGSSVSAARAAEREGFHPFAGIATREGPSNELRALIAAIAVETTIASVGAGRSEPPPVSEDLLMGAWRFGFITRLCEAALPQGITLSTPGSAAQ